MIAEVPEAQAAWIKTGNPAQAEVPALPGERFNGKVDYLYPELTQATRTLKIRIAINNPGGHLRPGMFATAHLEGPTQESVLTVPTEAVIQTGTRSIVIVADDAGHFRPVPIQVGAEQRWPFGDSAGPPSRTIHRRVGPVPDRLGGQSTHSLR